MSKIIVHGIPFSPYVRAVIMALQLKGVPYRAVTMDLRPVPGGLGSAEHLALHPFGRVPVIEDAGFRLYETQAILRYLDARYPQVPLQPTHPQTIGRMNQAIGILDSYMFTGAIRPIGAHRVVRPNLLGTPSDEAVVEAALPVAETSLKALDQVLGDGPFLAGAALSIADLMIAPQLHLLSPVPEVRALLHGTRLFPWLERMLALPCMTATAPPVELKLPARLVDLMAA